MGGKIDPSLPTLNQSAVWPGGMAVWDSVEPNCFVESSLIASYFRLPAAYQAGAFGSPDLPGLKPCARDHCRRVYRVRLAEMYVGLLFYCRSACGSSAFAVDFTLKFPPLLYIVRCMLLPICPSCRGTYGVLSVLSVMGRLSVHSPRFLASQLVAFGL